MVATPTADSSRWRSTRRRSTRRRRAVLLCVAVVLTFYVRSAWSYGKVLDPAPTSTSFQNRIADAFLAGQLNLKITPPAGLLRLPDPYDSVANSQYRGQGLHDLTLYKGKLYAYFGPAPAILLYIPFRALGVGQLAPTLATLIFCSAGFLFSLLLYRLLVRWCCEEVPVWMDCAAVFSLGLGVPTAWLIYVGRDYESSIACGYMLLFAGLYFLARGVLLRSGLVSLALGAGSLGMAVAARASLLPAGLFVLVAAAVITKAHPEEGRNGRLAALVLPYLAIGLLLALYNYARFDSIFEFGQSYQLLGTNPKTYPFNRLSYVPKGFYYYLLSPGRIVNTYPYLYLRKIIPFSVTRYSNEPVAGALTNMPVTVAGFVLAATSVRRLSLTFRRLFPMIAVLVVPTFVVLAFLSYTFAGSTMRYELDFVPLIGLGSTLCWAAWSRLRSRPSWVLWLGSGIWLLTLVGSVIFNVATTLTPCARSGSC